MKCLVVIIIKLKIESLKNSAIQMNKTALIVYFNEIEADGKLIFKQS